jgi:hypothetical protein
MVNEHALKNSFRAIKSDILGLQGELLNIRNEQAKILIELEKLTSTKDVVKTVARKLKTKYVASKEGKSFHIEECPYAQNIKPKSKVRFSSKTDALNKGYKPCNCVK